MKKDSYAFAARELIEEGGMGGGLAGGEGESVLHSDQLA